jgi:hypothetical protein
MGFAISMSSMVYVLVAGLMIFGIKKYMQPKAA